MALTIGSFKNANFQTRFLLNCSANFAPRGALRRYTSEIVAVQKLSTLQAYGRSVLGYIEVDLLSTQEKINPRRRYAP